MSKEAAMSMLTGTPAPQSPGLQAVEAPATTPVTPPVLESDRFAKQAKWEAEKVRFQLEQKKERESLAAEKEKLRAIQEKVRRFEEKKSTDGLAAIKELGYTEADYFNFAAMQDKPEPTLEEKAAQAAQAAAEARIRKFEEDQAAKIQKEIQERDQGVIQGFKSDLTKTLESQKDKLEYCAHYGPIAEDLAYEYVIEVVRESGGKDCPTVLEALEAVENYYEEQDKAMSGLKKRKPAEPAPDQQEAPKAPERTRTVTPGFPNADQPKPTLSKSRTLSNSATATVASTRVKANETKSEKRERLMEWLKNGVKS